MSMEIELGIIAARNIKACDLNGKSDGYVKVKLKGETDPNKKYKTKVYEPSLFPTWNETFRMKVNVGDTLSFKIMDQDKYTKDDIAGRVEYTFKKKLVNGVLHYKIRQIKHQGWFYFTIKCISGGEPFVPRDLKPDRKMVLKVVMKKTQFYKRGFEWTRSQLDVVENGPYCTGVHTVDTLDQYTPYNKLYWELESDMWFLVKTRVKDKMNFSFFYEAKSSMPMKYTMGRYKVPDFREGEKVDVAVPSKDIFTFHVSLECLKSIYSGVKPEQCPPPYDPKQSDYQTYEVIVHKGKKLKSKDFFTKADPYVWISTDKSKKVRETIRLSNDENPYFNQGFKIKACPGTDIKFGVYDENTFRRDQSLGSCKFVIKPDMPEEVTYKEELKLMEGKDATLEISVKRMRSVTQFFESRFPTYEPPKREIFGRDVEKMENDVRKMVRGVDKFCQAAHYASMFGGGF